MVQAVINMNEREDRILNIIKAQHGLKNKSQAIEFVLKIYAESFLEPELNPDFIKKMRKIDEEGKFISFNSIEELRESIENA